MMPVCVFLTGLAFGTEQFKVVLLADVCVITLGVAISAYGEAKLVMMGLVLLLSSLSFEAVRLTLTQQLIQSSGLKFNPLTTLYYVAPAAAMFLALPFIALEASPVYAFLLSAGVTGGLWHFILNGACAFCLNLSVFLLIGRTSALTMNVCGLVKDWFTIGASVVVFGSTVTPVNIAGYTVSFLGVLYYNYLRVGASISSATAPAEKTLLLLPGSEETDGKGLQRPLLLHTAVYVPSIGVCYSPDAHRSPVHAASWRKEGAATPHSDSMSPMDDAPGALKSSRDQHSKRIRQLTELRV